MGSGKATRTGDSMKAIDLTLEEAAKLLEESRKKHHTARLVDPEECRVLDIQDGACQYGKRCHDIWCSENRCSNCISYQACHTGADQEKKERVTDLLYEVQAKPVVVHIGDDMQVNASLELIDWREASTPELTGVAEKDNDNAAFLNSHDTLTGLLNQNSFYMTVRKMLEEQPDQDYMLVSCNLRNFHMINDLYGIEKGNEVLLTVAQALKKQMSDKSIAARLFGDHFAIFEPAEVDLDERIEQISKEAKLDVEGGEYPLHLHAGIYAIEDRNLPIAVMIDRAEMARKAIAHDYNINTAYYTPDLWESAVNKQWMINHFNDAIAADEFELYLQPQMDSIGHLAAAEALVRWRRPDGSLISPGDFIPCFEESGQIARLDQVIWEKAVQTLQDWTDSPLGHVDISINVSPGDFGYMDIEEFLTGLLEKYQVEQRRLHVEITETAVVYEIEKVDKLIRDGFHIEIDDFGKGYSSLNTLRNIRAQTLKLDMFFLRASEGTQERGHIIIDHVISMGRELGMKIVAEGVETEDQRDHLIEAGCDLLQGYLFSPPIPVQKFVEKYAD